MPHVDWTKLPAGVRQHFEERARTREVTKSDLLALMQRASTNPEVPHGPWYKDFGSFKLAGKGSLPKTFLSRDQTAFGTKL
jgi:hypothetical protein